VLKYRTVFTNAARKVCHGIIDHREFTEATHPSTAELPFGAYSHDYLDIKLLAAPPAERNSGAAILLLVNVSTYALVLSMLMILAFVPHGSAMELLGGLFSRAKQWRWSQTEGTHQGGSNNCSMSQAGSMS
jgi:hypothetical protein